MADFDLDDLDSVLLNPDEAGPASVAGSPVVQEEEVIPEVVPEVRRAPAPRAPAQAPVQVVPAPVHVVPAPVQQAVVPVTPQAAPAIIQHHQPAPLVLDDAEKKMLAVPGVGVVRFGDKVTRFPIERVKFTAARKTMIAILSENAITVKTHFHEDLKSFLCFGGECCEVCGLPNLKYMLPCFVYDTNDKGQAITQQLSLKVVALGQEQYSNLVSIHESLQETSETDENGVPLSGILTTDLIVSCTDEKWQKLTFTAVGRNRWRKFAAEAKHIREELAKWKANKALAYRCLAKNMDAKMFRKAMDLGSEVADPGTSNLDLSDVLGDV